MDEASPALACSIDFSLPMSYDGEEATTEQYSVIGLLCHSGPEDQRVHF